MPYVYICMTYIDLHFLFWSGSKTVVVEVKVELATVVGADELVGIFVELFPLPLLPFREIFALLLSLLDPLFALELFPVLLDDRTIFKGGTFNPLLADTASVAFPTLDDLPETLDELSLSSFSLSEWSRL